MFKDLSFDVILPQLFVALIIWLLLSYSNQYATEFIKNISRLLLDKIPWIGKFVQSKLFGYVGAIVIAVYVSFVFGVDIVGGFESVAGLDPNLIKLINAVIIAMGSNAVNDGRMKLPTSSAPSA